MLVARLQVLVLFQQLGLVLFLRFWLLFGYQTLRNIKYIHRCLQNECSPPCPSTVMVLVVVVVVICVNDVDDRTVYGA